MINKNQFLKVLHNDDPENLNKYCQTIKRPIFDEDNGNNVIHYALEISLLSKLKILGYYYPDLINQPNNLLEYPIQRAIKNGNLLVVKALVEMGACASVRDQDGYNCLHLSVSYLYEDIVSYLCTLLDPNSLSKDKESSSSSLHIAVHYNSAKIVKILIKAKANVNILNDYNETPLHIAATFGYTDIIGMLIRNRVNINQMNSNGNTALHLAVQMYQVETVKLLLKNNADINLINKKDQTVSIVAQRKIDVLTSLIQEGSTDKNSNTEKLNKMKKIFKLILDQKNSFHQKIKDLVHGFGKPEKSNNPAKESKYIFKKYTRIRSCFQ